MSQVREPPEQAPAATPAIRESVAAAQLVSSQFPGGRKSLSRRELNALAWQGRNCQNCESPLKGPFCHICGQPERTPVRALLALGGDAFDYLFDVDSRLLKTLRNLFFRPGRLTEAYLSGQRMSFVRPLRIYIVISALLFVMVSYSSNGGNFDDQTVIVDEGQIGPGDAKVPGGADAMRADASAAPSAVPEPRNPELPPIPAELSVRKPLKITVFGNKPWHAVDNPLIVPALPEWFNRQSNVFVGTVVQKAELARDNPKRLGQEFLRVLPQSMFVLLPIFALLLKLVLVFKRRLYMEHLMVAIHSHTFIFMGILVAMTLSRLSVFWPESWFNPWKLAMGLAIAWIPINLFVMQKRVYRQGFFGALFCSAIVGTLYLFLLSFTALGALVLSLVNL